MFSVGYGCAGKTGNVRKPGVLPWPDARVFIHATVDCTDFFLQDHLLARTAVTAGPIGRHRQGRQPSANRTRRNVGMFVRRPAVGPTHGALPEHDGGGGWQQQQRYAVVVPHEKKSTHTRSPRSTRPRLIIHVYTFTHTYTQTHARLGFFFSLDSLTRSFVQSVSLTGGADLLGSFSLAHSHSVTHSRAFTHGHFLRIPCDVSFRVAHTRLVS